MRQLFEGGVGRIPWDRMEEFLDREGVEERAHRDELRSLWQEMESQHLEWHRRRMKEAIDAAKRG